MRTRVKFCGCTSLEDAHLAAESGADAIGLIFAPSPRSVTLENAVAIARGLPPLLSVVGVFADDSADDIARARAAIPALVVQLHGDESPEYAAALGGAVIKTLHVDPAGAESASLERKARRYPPSVTLLFDSRGPDRGGNGIAFRWGAIASIARERRVIVAGGLTPENISSCVQTVRPYAVDVRSGVESDGRKDALKMRMFVQAIRDTDAA